MGDSVYFKTHTSLNQLAESLLYAYIIVRITGIVGPNGDSYSSLNAK